MPDTNRFTELCSRTRKDYPRFNVKERDKSWLRPIFWLLSKLTRQNYDTFTTTIFSTMYVGPTWKNKRLDQRYMTLRHEKIHIKQFHCFPLGRWAWPLNHLLCALCYLLLLPAIWTFRAKFEREAYTQTMLVEAEIKGTLSLKDMMRNSGWLGKTFGGSAYAWMWRKKKAEAWAADVMRRINAGDITNEADRVRLEPPP